MSARGLSEGDRAAHKLQRRRVSGARTRARSCLGLARERSGQLAHAKAEYEEYLRRYPQGEAAERVAFRLRICVRPKPRHAPVAGERRHTGMEVNGGVAADGALRRLTPEQRRTAADSQRCRLRRPSPIMPFSTRGPAGAPARESFDLIGRLSAGYDKSFARTSLHSAPTRVSIASIEVARPLRSDSWARGPSDKQRDGILGGFDGLFLSWQFKPSWAVNAADRYPVEQLSLTPQTQERLRPWHWPTRHERHWDGSLFAATQQFQGLRDRHAVGLEGLFSLARSLSRCSTTIPPTTPQHRQHARNAAATGALEREL